MITTSKLPATAADPRLRVNDPRWPAGIKPGGIVWGSKDGRTTTRMDFHVAENRAKAKLELELKQTTQRKLLWWDRKPVVGEMKVVNPTNMAITSRLTDVYEAVRQLDLTGLESRRLPADYQAKAGEVALRLHGEQKYYILNTEKPDAKTQAFLDAADSALLATSVGDTK